MWAKYHPSECQIVTLCSDGQISYWEVLDGDEIRAFGVGDHSGVTALDVDVSGDEFVVGDVASEARVINDEFYLDLRVDISSFRSGVIVKEICPNLAELNVEQ